MDNPYAVWQLSRAFFTAATHEDPATRARADQRAKDWLMVIQGMAGGSVSVGSRTPVRDLPAWVSLQVVRGGFATGAPAAGGPLEPDELARCELLAVPSTRSALFAYGLSERGLAEQWKMLDDGTYRIVLPEEGALLTVAWLVRSGQRRTALDLLDVLAPFADRLRFSARRSAARSAPPDQVSRRTAAEVRDELLAKRPQARVEAQREALAVWNPLADRFLGLWWTAEQTGSWTTADARDLLTDYDQAVVEHTRCGKHRRPKENLAVLVAATRARLDGGLDPRLAGRVRSAIDGMIAKRGEPGGDRLLELRTQQAEVTHLPAHRDLAEVAAARCAELRPDEGIAEIGPILSPTTSEESARFGVPRGIELPQSVHRRVRRARTAQVEALIADGVIPSSEVLAELIPGLTAQAVAQAYPDRALGQLMAATYEAFRRRRSLLLLDLAQQVQFSELPWVIAVQEHATTPQPDDTVEVARRVAALAVDAFPATILPNPLIQELSTLLAVADESIPLVEELAADIFTGRFSRKYLAAAQLAGRLLDGSLYALYYDLDYAQLDAPAPIRGVMARWRRKPAIGPRPTLAAVCARRVPDGDAWSPARNGMIIEQQQLYTTHNLAALVVAGMIPTRPWLDLAVDAAHRSAELLQLAQGHRRPLPRVKDAAYAWRQALFFLTQAGAEATAEFAGRVAASPTGSLWPMSEVTGGLLFVTSGGRFDDDGNSPGGRRLLGWATGPHWVLERRDAATT